MTKARMVSRDVREPAVAGSFYPGNSEALRRDLEALFRMVKVPEHGGVIRGIIAPHAGYMYSGLTAASAYARLSGARYDTVIIVSPSHRQFFEGISVYCGSAYDTPLGSVPVNPVLRERLLAACSIVTATDTGHKEEHAIEVHLPFLQKLLPPFQLLPIVMGNQTRDMCFTLGRALGVILRGENVLLVASTDLSHYYPSSVANHLDSVVIEDLKRFDDKGLMDDLDAGKCEACGGGPTVAVMAALKTLGAGTMEVVHHCNSGDITGDTSSVVGYVAAVAYA
jgi:AmmeMemoRadiSam system protein B